MTTEPDDGGLADLVTEIGTQVGSWQERAITLPGAEGRNVRKALNRFAEDIFDPIL